MHKPRIAYRPEIDGLRAIAVLGVVAFHAGLPVRGGFVGVDVFFVISGYLITSLLLAEFATTGRISYSTFYARRVRRLLPTLLLVVAATVAAACVLLSPLLHEVQDVAQSGVASLTLTSNVLFLRTTGDYFAGPAEFIPLLHVWSLSVEEQFYLAWPFLLALALMLRRPRAVTFIVASVVVASWLGALWMVALRPQAAFYLMPYRAWEFGIGALVGMHAPRLSERSRFSIASVAVLAIVLSLVMTPAGRWFPALGALAPVVGTALLLIAVGHGDSQFLVARALRSRPMVYVGRLSYAWYLWHWPPLALYSALSIDGGSALMRIVIATATILPAMVTLAVVEDPIRYRHFFPSWSTRKTLVVGLGTSAAAVLMFVVAGKVAHQVAARPSEINTLLAERGLDTDPCNLSTGAKALPPLDSVCVKGSATGGVVVLWGDSHALHWEPFAKALAAQRHEGMVQLTMLACAPVPRGFTAHSSDTKNPMWQRRCQENNDRALSLFRSGVFLGRRIDAVVVAAKWSDRVIRPYSVLGQTKYDQRTPAALASRREALETGFPLAIAAIPDSIQVFVMGPLPELRTTTPACLVRHVEAMCAMPRPVLDSVRHVVMPVLESIRASRRNTIIVDALHYFCDDRACPVRRHGILLFDDDEHVSLRAAQGFAAFWLQGEGQMFALRGPIDGVSSAVIGRMR